MRRASSRSASRCSNNPNCPARSSHCPWDVGNCERSSSNSAFSVVFFSACVFAYGSTISGHGTRCSIYAYMEMRGTNQFIMFTPKIGELLVETIHDCNMLRFLLRHRPQEILAYAITIQEHELYLISSSNLRIDSASFSSASR